MIFKIVYVYSLFMFMKDSNVMYKKSIFQNSVYHVRMCSSNVITTYHINYHILYSLILYSVACNGLLHRIY